MIAVLIFSIIMFILAIIEIILGIYGMKYDKWFILVVVSYSVILIMIGVMIVSVTKTIF